MSQVRIPIGSCRAVHLYSDLLNLNGANFTSKLLEERREKLPKVVCGTGLVLGDLPGNPPDILKAVKTLGLQGVMAKRRENAAACTGYAATMPARHP
jgi:ATP-dependent DNA ligase